MRRTRLSEHSCSIAKALDVLSDPWTMLILRDALLGVTRFDDFIERLGIPRATLSARLGHLCDHGVLRREAYQESPPRWEYLVTDKGDALRPIVLMLMRWGDEWLRDDEPPTYLEEVATGRRIEPVLVDRATGTELASLHTRVVGTVTEGLRLRAEPPDHRRPG